MHPVVAVVVAAAAVDAAVVAALPFVAAFACVIVLCVEVSKVDLAERFDQVDQFVDLAHFDRLAQSLD